MAVRRSPMFGTPNPTGQPNPSGMPMRIPMRPGMTGAPSGPGVGTPGTGMGPVPAVPPPPIQPNAGGPTSPMNIGSMLGTQAGGPGTPGTPGGNMGQAPMAPTSASVSVPLPPWGDSTGVPGTPLQGVDSQGQPDDSNTPSSSSVLMLKLLKQLGHI